MGEEQKKPEEKPEDQKNKDETPKTEEKKPVEPQKIILRVFMHCEGCARKVRSCLKGFPGVEEVITDCKASKVVVKGEKADPLKVLERVQKKSHRRVELISPIPKPAPEEPKKLPEVPKIELKKEEPPAVITVVLGVYMHCEGCAQEIKKRFLEMKGVESAEPDLKASQVTVKGVIDPEKLTNYVYKRTRKVATIVKVEPEKKEEKGKDEKKANEDKKDTKKSDDQETGKEKKEGGGGSGGGDPPKTKTEGETEDSKIELRKNEFYYHHPQNQQQFFPQKLVLEANDYYPPQMFSDENPNACHVM